MDMQLLVSTALVTPQVGRPAQSGTASTGNIATANVAAPTASGTASQVGVVQPAVANSGAAKAVMRQSAPNSALTTYRDQDSGRLIVRVYDRESGDVLVEFPPEKAFRPVESPVQSPTVGAKANLSV